MRRLLALLSAVTLVPMGTAAAFQLSERGRGAPFMPFARPGHFGRTFDVSVFLKGNLHTHTNRSDGDSSPDEVASWYRRHGYAFLALTDHNRLTDPSRWGALQDDHFRLLRGEEITMIGGGRQVHVNALCTKRRIGGGTFSSAADALSWATAQIASQGGVAIVNHPNFDHALEASDLAAARASLLEIASGHPYVNSAGSADRPSTEALWDIALEAGEGFMGVAVDDMHQLRAGANAAALPGRGWVQVFAGRDDPGEICDALRLGRLYSSTGPSLRRIRVTRDAYTIWAPARCEVSFTGEGGRVLEETTLEEEGQAASYVLRGGEAYVRAKVVGPEGGMAWTPAVSVTDAK